MADIEKQREQLKQAAKIGDALERRLYALAVVSDTIEGTAKPIVVGGNALEFYTFGGYATADVDVVYPDRRELDRALTALGFERSGRHWVRKDLDLAIECPDDILAGAMDRVTRVEIVGVGEVNLIGVEDLIIDRLNACVHWNSEDDCLWAARLLSEYRDRLDLGYLESRADPAVLERLRRILSEAEGV